MYSICGFKSNSCCHGKNTRGIRLQIYPGKILLERIFDENDVDFTLADYIDLVDSTGRLIVTNKKGFIDEDLPPILERFGVDGIAWIMRIIPDTYLHP